MQENDTPSPEAIVRAALEHEWIYGRITYKSLATLKELKGETDA